MHAWPTGMEYNLSELESTVQVLLLVDDWGKGNIQAIEFISKCGYQCKVVTNVKKIDISITEIASVNILLILAERNLAELIPFIRKSLSYYLPVVAIVNDPDDIKLAAYRCAGIENVLAFPFHKEMLLLSLESALRLAGNVRLNNPQPEREGQKPQFSQEQEIAAKIFSNILQSNYFNTSSVKSIISPMSLFNGDVLMVEKTPDNNLYLLLGDFTGHGFSASIGATPVADIFYGMSRKGFDLLAIVQSINSKLCKMLPANMFLAASAVALYPESKVLSVISCGLPEHYLINTLDASYIKIKSKNVPLGILEEQQFVVKNFSVTNNHRLYLLTDGVFEARNQCAEQFGSQRILSALTSSPDNGLDALQTSLKEYTRGSQQSDDISLVQLCCIVDQVPWIQPECEIASKHIEPLRWQESMMFDIKTLRSVNPVPIFVNSLIDIQGLQQYRQAIFIIVSELFANALDHGLLKLNSDTKKSPDGFLEYYQLKERRLHEKETGWIKMFFKHVPRENGGRLTIKIVDSGDGFDWKTRLHPSLDENMGFSGRGVKLVEALCSEVTFHGRGNRVTAVFDWKNSH